MNKFLKKAGAFALAAAFAVSSAIGAFAAPSDIIDTTQTASLTIHKYDITAAREDGVDVSSLANNGKQDTAAENLLEDYVIKGVEFTYVKVGDIHTESVGGNVSLLYDIPAALERVLGLTDGRGDHKHTSDEINKALSDILVSNTAGKNALENYVVTANGKVTLPETRDDGTIEATGLSLGLYLIVETKVPANVHTTVDPFFVSLPMTDETGDAWFYDVDVYPKNQTNIPDLDKLVKQHDDDGKLPYDDTATASEGDQVDFLLVSRLPKITSEATYLTEYTFTDKVDKGITYNKDAAVYFYDNENSARANNTGSAIKSWAAGSAAFSAEYDGSNLEYSQMTIAVTASGLKEIDPSLSQCWIVVAYTGRVNSDATPVLGDSGNDNDVKLTWRRTADTHYDTLEDRARVYTYGINLQKNFSAASGTKGVEADATKVQFVLKNEEDGHYITAKKSSAGVYYVTDNAKGAAESEGTVFSPDADGKLIINGLEANTYVLTEIHTSDGFSLLKEPITINIVSTIDDITPSKTTLYDVKDMNENNPYRHLIDEQVRRASATVDGKDTKMSEDALSTGASLNARVDMSVLNTSTFTLPQTGGYGTLLFTLAGCAAAFAGIVIATKKTQK